MITIRTLEGTVLSLDDPNGMEKQIASLLNVPVTRVQLFPDATGTFDFLLLLSSKDRVCLSFSPNALWTGLWATALSECQNESILSQFVHQPFSHIAWRDLGLVVNPHPLVEDHLLSHLHTIATHHPDLYDMLAGNPSDRILDELIRRADDRSIDITHLFENPNPRAMEMCIDYVKKNPTFDLTQVYWGNMMKSVSTEEEVEWFLNVFPSLSHVLCMNPSEATRRRFLERYPNPESAPLRRDPHPEMDVYHVHFLNRLNRQDDPIHKELSEFKSHLWFCARHPSPLIVEWWIEHLSTGSLSSVFRRERVKRALFANPNPEMVAFLLTIGKEDKDKKDDTHLDWLIDPVDPIASRRWFCNNRNPDAQKMCLEWMESPVTSIDTKDLFEMLTECQLSSMMVNLLYHFQSRLGTLTNDPQWMRIKTNLFQVLSKNNETEVVFFDEKKMFIQDT